MGLRRTLKSSLERLMNRQVYIARTLPRGINISYDIRNAFKNYSCKVIIDVGANIGLFTQQMLIDFPKSEFYCCEPVSSTYNVLAKRFESEFNVRCFQLALSDIERKGFMALTKKSVTNYLIDDEHLGSDNEFKTEPVMVSTLDQFCQKHHIEQISYLKIDTEGEDLAVLKGSRTMLEQQCIDFIQVEAGFTSSNNYHIPFEVLQQYLESYQYFLFGVYAQEKLNRWASPVFVSPRLPNSK